MKAKPEVQMSQEADQFDSDNELWETRQLGASPEHAVRSTAAEDKALDDSMGLQLLTFRIQKPIVDQLRLLAKLEGIGYQPLMRLVLTKYVRANEHRLQQVLTPQEASDQAELLLSQAIKLKEIMLSLKPMTPERMSAECEYSTALGAANSLYHRAQEKCSDTVLKKHLKLRINQILSLLNEDLPQLPKKNKRKAI